MTVLLSRRQMLAASGLVVAFSLTSRSVAQLSGGGEGGPGPEIVAPDLPGSLKSHPVLDAWIRIDRKGHATIFTGKAELGQGIASALWQVASEELDLSLAQVEIVTADSGRTPDEGLTAGSHSMQDGGTAIANAAANVRMLLTRAAAARWGVGVKTVDTNGKGSVIAADGRKLSYGVLAAGLNLHVAAIKDAPRRDPARYRTMAHDVPRFDIPAKLTGGEAFVQDMRLPGMLHARVVRGPSFGTELKEADFDAAARMPGVVKIVRDGSFAAVVARTQWQAIAALRFLQEAPWARSAPPLPSLGVAETLMALPAHDIVVLDTHDQVAPAQRRVVARYSRPWLSHGSIGPSCSVTLFKDGELTIWSHSQGIFDVQRSVAQLVGLPAEKVRCIHTQGSGCYGQNGADDVSADAGLIAVAMPGVPIKLQWMREQEFGWEPLGPAMVSELTGILGADGKIVAWKHDVWSNPHNNRPTDAAGYVAGQEITKPYPVPVGKPIPMPEGDGDRNSNPLYALPNMQVLYHFLPQMPLRVSALRSLGAHLNIFSIESMFDELAHACGQDPLAFRLAHMEDPRARAVMIEATTRFGWSKRVRGNGRRGTGMAFARYKNIGAYCAIAMEVEIERETGVVTVRRVQAAVDAGQPASPDGIRNQVEGGIVQSLSWTTRESVTFEPSHRTSFDWSAYPISRFSDVPGEIDVHVLPQSGMPFLGAGETAQGPTAAAFANAIADATGVRLREMPLTPDKLKSALGPI